MWLDDSLSNVQQLIDKIPHGKKVFFCSDFHLGSPINTYEENVTREIEIVNWLNAIEREAGLIMILGDVFDVWYEYHFLVPKYGYIPFFSKLYELRKKGIPIIFFTGNHDYFMYDFFPKNFDIPVFKKPQSFLLFGKKILAGHGDGLGPRDYYFKLHKYMWGTSFFRIMVEILPSYITWKVIIRTLKINKKNASKSFFQKDQEWIVQWIKKFHATHPHHIYMFGHRHLPINWNHENGFKYVNLGEWINLRTYVEICEKEGLQYKYWDPIQQKGLPYQAFPLEDVTTQQSI